MTCVVATTNAIYPWSSVTKLVISIRISLIEGLLLTKTLLSQELLVIMLKYSLRKLYDCHHDLGSHCDISVSQMTKDILRLS
jgi:hypothetical protein